MTPEGAPLFTQGSGLEEEFEELREGMGEGEKVSHFWEDWDFLGGVGKWVDCGFGDAGNNEEPSKCVYRNGFAEGD